MAQKGDNLLLYQQNNKLDGGASGNKPIKKPSPMINSSATHQLRASVDSSLNGDSIRRASSGKFSSPNNKEEVIPHYLRASTGSCHDFCKYGKRHTVEEKPWHSISKRQAKTPSSKLHSKEYAISVERNKVREAKHRPQEIKIGAEDLNQSPDSKTISQNSSEIIKDELSLPPKEADLSQETNKVREEKHRPPQETESHVEDVNPSPDSKTFLKNPSEIINKEVSLPPKEAELSPEKLETATDVLETDLKTSNTPLGHAPMLQPIAVSMKASPASENSEGNHRKGRIYSKIKDGKLPQAFKLSHLSDASQGEVGRSRMHSDIKDKKTVAESKALQKKVLGASGNMPPSMVSANKIRNLTSTKNSNSKLGPLKDRNIILKAVNVKQTKNEKVSVKTLYALETRTVKPLAKPVRNKGVAASSRKQDPIGEDIMVCNHRDWEEEEGERDEEEAGNLDDTATKLITINKDASKGKRKEGVEGKITRTLRKGTPIFSKDKDSPPMKLSFRRGKVIQLHSDNSTPIRLKFRRGRILLGNKDGMANVKKIVKKKGVVDDKDVADLSSKKFVLRHQAVQDKKIDPGLLNNVIEETASKLAESRKSKVKALVGAFETVISLQES